MDSLVYRILEWAFDRIVPWTCIFMLIAVVVMIFKLVFSILFYG